MRSTSPIYRIGLLALAAGLVSSVHALPALAEPTAPAAHVGKAVYDRVSPLMVVVEYVWKSETRTQEITVSAVVVSEDTVMIPAVSVPDQAIPDAQLQDFKIILPRIDQDHEELDAEFLGRDERWNVAYVKLKDSARKLPTTPAGDKAIKFTDKPVEVGDTVYSVGMLAKNAGYRTYLAVGTVGALQRGEVPTVLVSGELAAAGGIVFDAGGDAIGYVQPHDGAFFWLDPRPRQVTVDNPRFFVPASEVLPALANLPTENKWAPLPFTGIMSLNGLSKEVAEFYNLVGTPAVEIGDVVPGSAAAKAGLEKGSIITEVNGKPLERGDEPEELGPIMARSLRRTVKPGDTVTFTVIAKKGEAPKQVQVVAGERPAQAHTAARFYDEDLGFTVRDAVFLDRYNRKLATDAPGVVVDFVKPNSSAQTGRLARGDFVNQFNGNAVTTVDAFKSAYQQFRKDKPREAIVLQVLREGNTQIIRIEPPQ